MGWLLVRDGAREARSELDLLWLVFAGPGAAGGDEGGEAVDAGGGGAEMGAV